MTVYESLKDIAKPARGSCVALGLFDGLHPGHRAVIAAAVDCARTGGVTACIFTFSARRERPAAKPKAGWLLTEDGRNRLLEEMGADMLVCPPFEAFRDLTPERFVAEILHELLGARAVYCGENYRFGRGGQGTVDDLRRLGEPLGIRVHTLPMIQVDGAPVSSTRIRALIAGGDMPGAARLLGRPFSIDFEVVHGRRLGRTIDSPTINQELPGWFITPRFGVYASVTTVDGVRYVSVSNVGVKPTVGSDRVLSETCILGYNGDLYGRRVPVEFYDFIRPETKFESVDALRAQIARDAARAREICQQRGLAVPRIPTTGKEP